MLQLLEVIKNYICFYLINKITDKTGRQCIVAAIDVKKNLNINSWNVFTHGGRYKLPDNKILVGSYHPSPRNVNTRRIDIAKMVLLLQEVKKILKK